MNLDPALVRYQIESLKLACPEAWDEGDDMLLADMLEAETDLREFLTVVEDRRQDAAALAGGIASRIAELQLRQLRFERRERAMRDLVLKLMQTAEIKKLELSIATLSVTPGKPKIIITSEQDLPADCIRNKPEPDKAKIKSYLDAGQEVPGAVFSNAEPHLTIRTK